MQSRQCFDPSSLILRLVIKIWVEYFKLQVESRDRTHATSFGQPNQPSNHPNDQKLEQPMGEVGRMEGKERKLSAC